MPTAVDRPEIRRDLIRLLAGLDFYRSWRLSILRRDNPNCANDQLENEVVMPGTWWLQQFDDSTASRCSQILKEVRLFYSYTAGDLSYFRRLGDVQRAEVDQFLEDFRTTVGFSFDAEAGELQQTVNRVLKRRSIANKAEYDVLRELEVDPSSTRLSRQDKSTIYALLRSFENHQ